MPEQPTFEFLLPLFGDPELCRLAIASVLDQTHTNFRLTIVDDSYPQFPLARYIRGLADPRVSYRQNDVALGAGGNFRRVLSVASSERVTFMGSDDRLHPHYLAQVAALLSQYPEADIIQPGVRIIDAAGIPLMEMTDRAKRLLAPKISSQPTLLEGEPLAASLLRGNWSYFPSLMWRRSAISAIGFREYDVVQDLGLLLDVVMSGGSMLVDPTLAFDYRRHAGSLSVIRAQTGARFDEERSYFNDVAKSLTALGWQRAARSAKMRLASRLHAGSLAPRALAAADINLARQLLRHALGA
ncbi:hypothetical protein BH09ACT12_BH09ACT12_04030 [soil metagenome]